MYDSIYMKHPGQANQWLTIVEGNRGKQQLIAKGYSIFLGNENITKLVVVMVAQLNIVQIIHFKQVNFMLCELCLNKAITKKSIIFFKHHGFCFFFFFFVNLKPGKRVHQYTPNYGKFNINRNFDHFPVLTRNWRYH